MKNYKQILEAINRGIKFALNDLEDDEELSSISKQKQGQIEDKSYTKKLLDLKKEVVDLGLPSGTLWCKYNLDVNPNQLSKAEDWYGCYYAWGELEPNKTKNYEIYFVWDNYEHGDGPYNLYKYVNNKEYAAVDDDNKVDNLTKLQPEDDAAYQNKKLHNFKFHIPTREQCEELINYTKSYWVNNYDPNKLDHNPEDDGGIQGLNGRIFEGKNGNQMFIPAAGYRDGSKIYNAGSRCYLWSSSLFLNCPSYACSFDFGSSYIGIYDNKRCNGYNVCPVINL